MRITRAEFPALPRPVAWVDAERNGLGILLSVTTEGDALPSYMAEFPSDTRAGFMWMARDWLLGLLIFPADDAAWSTAVNEVIERMGRELFSLRQ